MRNGSRLRLAAALVAAAALLGGCLPIAPFSGPTDPQRSLTNGGVSDPSVLVEGTNSYVYGSNWLYGSQAAHVPVLTSTTGNLRDLRWQADALPHPPAWTTNGQFWAPTIGKVGSTYLLFYSALNNTLAPARRCVSVATSSSPVGPFTDARTTPLVCMTGDGGSIDPFFFADTDGRNYLLWKTEGVVNVEPTMIWARELTAGGTTWATGSTTRMLLATAQPWEGTVIENPALVRSGAQYWLFYSANNYDTSRYAIGVATCSSPLGACARVYSTPIIASRGSMAGPGGPFPFRTSAGTTQLAFSAWMAGQVGGGYDRFLFTLPLSFPSGEPNFG